MAKPFDPEKIVVSVGGIDIAPMGFDFDPRCSICGDPIDTHGQYYQDAKDKNVYRCLGCQDNWIPR